MVQLDLQVRVHYAGGARYTLKEVPGTSVEDLDHQLLARYFRTARSQDCPDDEDRGGWERLLVNTDLMLEDRGRTVPNVGAVLLFGNKILRDYGFIEATGLGVPRAIIRGMREHNGAEPDPVELDERFLVRLWKG